MHNDFCSKCRCKQLPYCVTESYEYKYRCKTPIKFAPVTSFRRTGLLPGDMYSLLRSIDFRYFDAEWKSHFPQFLNAFRTRFMQSQRVGNTSVAAVYKGHKDRFSPSFSIEIIFVSIVTDFYSFTFLVLKCIKTTFR